MVLAFWLDTRPRDRRRDGRIEKAKKNKWWTERRIKRHYHNRYEDSSLLEDYEDRRSLEQVARWNSLLRFELSCSCLSLHVFAPLAFITSDLVYLALFHFFRAWKHYMFSRAFLSWRLSPCLAPLSAFPSLALLTCCIAQRTYCYVEDSLCTWCKQHNTDLFSPFLFL